MTPAIIQTLLKSMGVNPDELKAQAGAAFALVQSIDARLSLLAAQNELILKLLQSPGAASVKQIIPNGAAHAAAQESGGNENS